jgi:hypothetical protein
MSWKSISWHTIATMFDKLIAQLLCHDIHCKFANFPFGIDGVAKSLRSSDYLFYRCKTELNRVELWEIGWKVDKLDSSDSKNLPYSGTSVDCSIVTDKHRVCIQISVHTRDLQELISDQNLAESLDWHLLAKSNSRKCSNLARLKVSGVVVSATIPSTKIWQYAPALRILINNQASCRCSLLWSGKWTE